ncbi:MAG: Cys-tRNA(Pro) deacylase [Acetobacter sp.]|jgi:Cys-tRNA(Pro)/Cys-tRNA(Cys) deacylase|nr:Cys-tRNA(Pro) deacylase [Acetobacter sp.]
MSKRTPASTFLEKHGVPFTMHSYDYDGSVGKLGIHAAAAVGQPPEKVFKTLMAEVDGKHVCLVIPVACEASMKKIAAACSGKKAHMMKPADAERITGFQVGGISPFGQRRKIPVLVAEEAGQQEKIFVNGGGRGLQVEVATADLLRILGASLTDLTA